MINVFQIEFLITYTIFTSRFGRYVFILPLYRLGVGTFFPFYFLLFSFYFIVRSSSFLRPIVNPRR